MIVVPQSCTLLTHTPDPERLIEAAGRTCYKSEDRITESSCGPFVKRLVDSQHESVLEHASATFRLVTDRAIANELVRHRIASYSQESTRYVNYGKKGRSVGFVSPVAVSQTVVDLWTLSCLEAERRYFDMLDAGATPEVARDVLPLSTRTEIVATMNLRAWRHFLRERTSVKAHPKMRALAGLVAKGLTAIAPVVFSEWTEQA